MLIKRALLEIDMYIEAMTHAGKKINKITVSEKAYDVIKKNAGQDGISLNCDALYYKSYPVIKNL